MWGTRDDREGLAALLAYARSGDTVVVVAHDRLGRSLRGIVAELSKRDIALRSLRESIDTSTPGGEMLVGIFGSLAQDERDLINERAQAACEAAAARGRLIGRPKALDPERAALARRMRAAGEPVDEQGAGGGGDRADEGSIAARGSSGPDGTVVETVTGPWMSLAAAPRPGRGPSAASRTCRGRTRRRGTGRPGRRAGRGCGGWVRRWRGGTEVGLGGHGTADLPRGADRSTAQLVDVSRSRRRGSRDGADNGGLGRDAAFNVTAGVDRAVTQARP